MLKDAFVASDSVNARKIAEQLLKSASAESKSEAMIEAARTIAASDDLSEQRVAFKTITDELIANLKAVETEEPVFVQYCPMAFDNTGANWLSLSEEIRNPYFGEKMLKCGRIVEEL